MQFIPFAQLNHRQDVVVVDAFHPRGWALTHWRGASKLPELHDDTSTGIVLNALENAHPSTQLPYVSNNHFDIDGFLGVWALHHPSLALKNAPTLRRAALIGDFREYSHRDPHSDLALKLCCWINTLEKKHFYRPFAASNEVRASVDKYTYFLPRFEEVLLEPDRFKSEWEEEYDQVCQDLAILQNPAQSSFHWESSIRLKIVITEEPMHYYALFSDTQEVDMVLSLYSDQRYELEYKYSTWVDTNRISYPRISLESLTGILNRHESSGFHWEGQSIKDTGPLLRLEGKALSKQDRFAHPIERNIFPSSIPSQEFRNFVVGYYQEMLSHVTPKNNWSWNEMKAYS